MLNIALIFDDSDAEKLKILSQSTCEKSIFKLGIHSEPHITLAHMITAPKTAEKFIPLLEKNFKGHEFNVEIGALHISNQKERKRIYYVLKILNNDDLRTIQEKITSLFPDIKLGNKSGEKYFGHITLGCLDGDGHKVEDILNIDAPFKTAKTKLCIGSRDSYGRMEKIHKIIT